MFDLTREERESPLWLKIKAGLEARLEMHRKKNDNPQGVEETADLRGRIAEAKFFLGLGNEKPEVRGLGAQRPKPTRGAY